MSTESAMKLKMFIMGKRGEEKMREKNACCLKYVQMQKRLCAAL